MGNPAAMTAVAVQLNVRFGSWLCKNAKRLKRDGISYSSKTALVVQHAIQFDLEVELKNIILVAFRYFEFLHSQGPKSAALTARRVLPVFPGKPGIPGRTPIYKKNPATMDRGSGSSSAWRTSGPHARTIFEGTV
jgi:hypothetical protein